MSEAAADPAPKVISGREMVGFDDVVEMDLPPPPKREFDAAEDKKAAEAPVKLGNRTDQSDRVEAVPEKDRVVEEEEAPKKAKDEGKPEGRGDDEPEDRVASGETGPQDDVVEFKVVKASDGDQELELSEGTVIPTKVAGQTLNPTLADLRKDYSARTNWDKKYNELNVERQGYIREKVDFDEEKSQLESNLTKLVEETANKPFAFYDFVANVHKIDPVKLKMDAIKAMIQQVEPLTKMDGPEREAYLRRLEVDFKSEATDAKERELNQRESLKTIRKEAAELRENYGIEEDDFRAAKKEAQKYVEDASKLTPKDVVFVQRHFMVADIIEKDRPDIAKREDVEKILTQIRDQALDNPTWRKDDIIDLLTQAFPKEDENSSSDLKRLGRKAKPDTGTKVKEETKVKDPVSFDDLW